ncbi:hypothetical protein P7K49_012324, partial [Saguinus oedipus]
MSGATRNGLKTGSADVLQGTVQGGHFPTPSSRVGAEIDRAHPPAIATVKPGSRWRGPEQETLVNVQRALSFCPSTGQQLVLEVSHLQTMTSESGLVTSQRSSRKETNESGLRGSKYTGTERSKRKGGWQICRKKT